jgi:Flp pilus assembly pilin Flp
LAPRPVPRLQALLIAVAAISAFQLVGTNLSNTFHGVATQL